MQRMMQQLQAALLTLMMSLSAGVPLLAVAPADAAASSSTPRLATSAAGHDDQPDQPIPAQRIVRGKIASVSEAAHSFVLAVKGGENLTLNYDNKTLFAIDGKPAAMSQVLKPGTQVTVTYENHLAVSISVASAVH